MKTADEFKAFYDQNLVAPLRALDAQRGRLCGRVLLTSLVVALCVIAAIAIGCLYESQLNRSAVPGVIAFITLIIVVCYMISSVNEKIRAYGAEFKRTVLRGIIDFVQPGLTYAPGSSLSLQVYQASGLFPGPKVDRYMGSDLVEGTIGVTPFRFSQMHAEEKVREKTEDGNRDKWRTIFKGLMFVGEFNKTFEGRTFVFPDTAERLFGWVGALMQKLHGGHGELVKLEDPEFEKRFVVYGSNQLEARYVLSPSLMSRLSEFKDKSNRWVAVAFVQSSLYVAIGYSETLFRPSLFRSMLDYERIKKSFDALSLVLGLVEELNLNVRIWGARAVPPT